MPLLCMSNELEQVVYSSKLQAISKIRNLLFHCYISSQFSGHCWRSKNEIVSQLLLWDPKHDRCSRGRPATTFIDQLDEDTSLFRLELPAVMADRGEWDKLIKSV